MALAMAVSAIAASNDPSLLANAARNGDKAALRSLLKQGADVNATQADGMTALHWASYRDDLESADLLIRAARTRMRRTTWASPLWTASNRTAARAMARRLLGSGREPERRPCRPGRRW